MKIYSVEFANVVWYVGSDNWDDKKAVVNMPNGEKNVVGNFRYPLDALRSAVRTSFRPSPSEEKLDEIMGSAISFDADNLPLNGISICI